MRLGFARIGLLAIAMQDFSGLLIAHVTRGGVLDDGSLAEIRSKAIDNLKNSQANGLPIGDEAQAFRESIADLELWIDRAIGRGRDAAKK